MCIHTYTPSSLISVVFLPSPTLLLMFNDLLQSPAAFSHFQVKLLSFFTPPKNLIWSFPVFSFSCSKQVHLTNQIQWAHSHTRLSSPRSHPSPFSSVLPIHTKKIRLSNRQCREQMLQQQMLQQYRTAGCSVIQFSLTWFWVTNYITHILKRHGVI